MPFPTPPVLPRRTDGLHEFEDVLQDTGTPHRPVQRLPEKVCLTPTRGVLPAGHHAPTLTTRPGAGGQRPTAANDVGQGSPVSVGVTSFGVSGDLVCRDEGTRKMMPVERATRRGKTRTGGRCLCTLMVWFFLTATSLMVDVVGAVFAPANRDALKAAVGTCTSSGVCTGGCLGETADGSCPIFAASNDATGNPYGVIGDWDVSAVTSMVTSKCTLSLSLSVATAPSVVVSGHNSHTFCSFVVFVV
jgi:hypothetical protein